VTPLRQVLEFHGRTGTAADGQYPYARASHLDLDGPAVAELVADVAAAVSRQAAAVSEAVYQVILREIAPLNDDKPLRALLASSVDSNVNTCLQIMQHRIDLAAVQAPTVAVEYARRLAQRGTPLTALLRADAAQEHGPVPDPQGRGDPRQASGREPA